MDKQGVKHSSTGDGSSTLYSERHKALYHSQNGAIAESEHIFIHAGFNAIGLLNINVLEVGYGTGLNAALTAYKSLQRKVKTNYHAIELYPLTKDDYQLLNYSKVLKPDVATMWADVCALPWNQEGKLNDSFIIEKSSVDFTTWQANRKYDLVYFDAFAPDDQPEMWEEKHFQKIFNALNKGGVLVTYCVKGIVKERLRASGFQLERMPGPPGKNHMLRAWKK